MLEIWQKGTLMGLLKVPKTSQLKVTAKRGPYVVTVREMGLCPEYDTDDDLKIEGVLHFNRSSKDNLLFNGYGTVKNNILTRGATRATIDFAKWDSVSGWREHYLVMPFGDVCFLLEDIVTDLAELLSKHVDGFPRKCPLRNITYNVTNTPSRIGQLRHFPVLPYGRFRAHVLYFHAKKPQVTKPRACTKLIVDVSPKPTT
ncbi:uncharacterized protein LOC117645566 [Thrips palmi]|uniref:Uncharacterized protein LOC117645566 n=1 Tax=Thrips palmi TaxID=161013 RepID=A0A6P8YWV9_THRPL|nr:uncharacterized protein LOC117645566 [Thrips palmi]